MYIEHLRCYFDVYECEQKETDFNICVINELLD